MPHISFSCFPPVTSRVDRLANARIHEAQAVNTVHGYVCADYILRSCSTMQQLRCLYCWLMFDLRPCQ